MRSSLADSSSSSQLERPPHRWESISAHLLTAALLLTAAAFALYPFFSRLSWMVFEEDDFFYYLVIANNLARGFGSTFNGIVHTNGYHPLWLALLSLNSSLSTSPIATQIFLALALFAATASTYFLARRLLQRHTSGPLIAAALAAYIALYSMHQFQGGMEIILTIPLLLTVCTIFQSSWLWSGMLSRWLIFGLLLSAVFLSRLDTALLLALLFLATLLQPELRTRIRSAQIVGLILGLVPSALYIVSNRIFFSTWMPISGMAKQLKPTHALASQPWHSLFGKSPAALLNLIPIFLAIVLLIAVWRNFTPTQRALYPVVLLFPFIYLTVLSSLSDWPLWDWYFYSLRIALTIAFAVLLTWSPTRRLLANPAIAALIALFVLAQLALTRRGTGEGIAILSTATELQTFAATHPGAYAMGDRAGMVAYLLPDPVIQTEGLVMDRAFLSSIRHQQPLDQVLAQYHVRYYIATDHQPYTGGCFTAIEPFQAGTASPHMTTTICRPPTAIFPHPNGLTTLVFDMQPPSAP